MRICWLDIGPPAHISIFLKFSVRQTSLYYLEITVYSTVKFTSNHPKIKSNILLYLVLIFFFLKTHMVGTSPSNVKPPTSQTYSSFNIIELYLFCTKIRFHMAIPKCVLVAWAAGLVCRLLFVLVAGSLIVQPATKIGSLAVLILTQELGFKLLPP